MALKSYEELVKVDVSQYCEKRDGFTYLNWAKCIELLRQNGATVVYWEPVPDPQTGSSLRKTDIEFKDKNNNTNRCYETRIKVVIDDKEYEMQTPVMNGANPVKDNSMSQQRVWNSMCRAFVKCVESLIPVQEANEIIQGTIAQSAVLSRGRKLANMTSKQYKMPVLDMLPIAYFVNGDNGQKKTTKQAWDKKFIIAEEIAVIVPIPESVLDDAEYDIWGEVKPRVTEAFGAKIDGAVLFGVDKPSTWRDDVIATATKAKTTVTLGAEDSLYDKIMSEDGVIAKVENCGYMVNGHMADITMRAKLRGLKNANGDPLFKTDMQGATSYALDGSPMNFPNNGSFDKTKALMISGDFSQLVYSIRQDITFKLFTEGVIQNTDGSIAYNLMQNDMIALRAVMRLGWEIPNPINALEKDKTKRCPFAILKSE